MLAGHTHGGQFRLPEFGPFVCPSRLPLEFASGAIYEEPTTLHVSRGLSSEIPLRLNCRPEITKLVLHGAQRNFETREIESQILDGVDALRGSWSEVQEQTQLSEKVHI